GWCPRDNIVRNDRTVRSLGAVWLPTVTQTGKSKDLGLVKVLDRIEAAIHIDIKGRIADRHLRFVAGRYHHKIELVGNRHKDRTAGTGLQIFFSDIARQAAKSLCKRHFKPLNRRRDR